MSERRTPTQQPALPYTNSLTGRRRKLSDGAMLAICRQFASGERVRNLAREYGVSTHTIYAIVYWTPRDT